MSSKIYHKSEWTKISENNAEKFIQCLEALYVFISSGMRRLTTTVRSDQLCSPSSVEVCGSRNKCTLSLQLGVTVGLRDDQRPTKKDETYLGDFTSRTQSLCIDLNLNSVLTWSSDQQPTLLFWPSAVTKFQLPTTDGSNLSNAYSRWF